MSRQVQVPGVGMIALGVFVVAFVLLMVIGHSFLGALFFALALTVAVAIFFAVAREGRKTGAAEPSSAGRGAGSTAPQSSAKPKPEPAAPRAAAGAGASEVEAATPPGSPDPAPGSAPESAEAGSGTSVVEARPDPGSADQPFAAKEEESPAEPAASEETTAAPQAAPAATKAGAQAEPPRLDAPRDGGADDLKRIKGIGPRLEETLNCMGFYHFDQIAAWGPAEVAWMDVHLENFPGRVSRDDWVGQARHLAGGGETEPAHQTDGGTAHD